MASEWFDEDENTHRRDTQGLHFISPLCVLTCPAETGLCSCLRADNNRTEECNPEQWLQHGQIVRDSASVVEIRLPDFRAQLDTPVSKAFAHVR